MGLALPVVVSHADPHWPALFLLQFGLCVSTMAMLGYTYCGHRYNDTESDAPFADTLSLCAKLLLPHVLTMGGVYLLLRAKLVAFGRALSSTQQHNSLAVGGACSDGTNTNATPLASISVATTSGKSGKSSELSAHARRVATACTQGLKWLPRAWLPRAAKDATAAPPTAANAV